MKSVDPSMSSKRYGLGFSLIEVMIAVVVLATGLLALAALQGALARSSADAKARSAIMSALNSRMSQLRQAPPADGETTMTCVNAPWVCTTQQQASTGGLSVQQDVATLLWKGGTFQAPGPGDDLTGPAFKRFRLTATWNDASNSPRSLTLSSDASGLMYGLGYPDTDPTSSALAGPVVRQKDPGLEAGVIPIAYGSGQDSQSTAASNPKPVLIGETTLVGTQFDVLTYVPENNTDETAIIRRRVDTNLIKCRCTTGLADRDRYSVAGVAQWPTVWTGSSYETYEVAGNSLPPAEALKAGEDPAFAGRNRKQSELCTECCRDRHDDVTMPVRFGPEGGMDRFDLNGAGVLSVSTSGKFVAACRVIRDDGIYKTASDMYLRQFALLETTPDPADSTDPLTFAKNGTPKSIATAGYGNFVKQYLEGYFTSINSSGSAPTTVDIAQQAFDDYAAGSLNSPENVAIPAVSAADERFLHARGLYVDYLNSEARDKIRNVLDQCVSDQLDCLLPHLAFTTINLTELAKWSASDNRLNVTQAGTLLGTSVDQPMGGRTYGRSETTSSFANVSSSLSNSTLAFRADIPFVNTDEADPDNWLTDRQQFSVGGTGSGEEAPYVEVVPQGLLPDSALNRISVTMTGATGSGACAPGATSYRCDTAIGGLPATVGLTFTGYNVQENTNGDPVLVHCGTKDLSVNRPYRITYSSIVVSDTSGGGALGTISYTPATSRSVPQTATWGSLSRATTERLFVTFSGGEKTCPEAAICGQGNKFSGWSTTYTAAACAVETYTPAP